jgi:hypothetical protein
MGARMDRAGFDTAFGADVAGIASRIALAAGAGLRPSFTELMAFGIQRRYYKTKAESSSIDYRYWSENGWLDPGRDYYCDAAINPFRKLLARMAGRIVSSLVLR